MLKWLASSSLVDMIFLEKYITDLFCHLQSKKNMKIRNECLLDILKQRDSRCYEDFRKELSDEQEDLVDDYLPYFETGILF